MYRPPKNAFKVSVVQKAPTKTLVLEECTAISNTGDWLQIKYKTSAGMSEVRFVVAPILYYEILHPSEEGDKTTCQPTQTLS